MRVCLLCERSSARTSAIDSEYDEGKYCVCFNFNPLRALSSPIVRARWSSSSFLSVQARLNQTDRTCAAVSAGGRNTIFPDRLCFFCDPRSSRIYALGEKFFLHITSITHIILFTIRTGLRVLSRYLLAGRWCACSNKKTEKRIEISWCDDDDGRAAAPHKCDEERKNYTEGKSICPVLTNSHRTHPFDVVPMLLPSKNSLFHRPCVLLYTIFFLLFFRGAELCRCGTEKERKCFRLILYFIPHTFFFALNTPEWCCRKKNSRK